MIIGETIVSAYPYPADRSSFAIEKKNFKTKTIRPIISQETKKLNKLYSIVSGMRQNTADFNMLENVLEEVISSYQADWLLVLEICELTKSDSECLYNIAHAHLMDMINLYPDYKKLIIDGLKIIK